MLLYRRIKKCKTCDLLWCESAERCRKAETAYEIIVVDDDSAMERIERSKTA